MTKQEFFDINWQHFVVENAPLSTFGGMCAYRGHNGARCAVGMIIPDRFYDSNLETHSPMAEKFNEIADELEWDQDFRDFLEMAQDTLHDKFVTAAGTIFSPDSPAFRRSQYVRFAEDYGLNVPEENK